MKNELTIPTGKHSELGCQRRKLIIVVFGLQMAKQELATYRLMSPKNFYYKFEIFFFSVNTICNR